MTAISRSPSPSSDSDDEIEFMRRRQSGIPFEEIAIETLRAQSVFLSAALQRSAEREYGKSERAVQVIECLNRTDASKPHLQDLQKTLDLLEEGNASLRASHKEAQEKLKEQSKQMAEARAIFHAKERALKTQKTSVLAEYIYEAGEAINRHYV